MRTKHLMRGSGMGREPPIEMFEPLLWQRSTATDVVEDEAARYLDLAEFADGMLDADDKERVAERLAFDRDALSDVEAARFVPGSMQHEPLSEAAIAAACALVPRRGQSGGEVVSFASRTRQRPRLHTIAQWGAQWGSLAAAVAVAGWLGFTLGMDTVGDLTQNNRSGDDSFFNELLDPPGGILRDLTEGPRT